MQFAPRKHRRPPSIIIVSLIDVLIVVLIFLMVTTTFKKQPSLPLALPESNQPKQPGANENTLNVTIYAKPPIFFDEKPVTMEKLQELLIDAVKKNPKAVLKINADKEAPFGQIVKVMDAAKAANIKAVSANTQEVPKL
jgi:biopolymer transport protein ExbD